MLDHRPAEVPALWLGKPVTVEVDRPIGSRHPRFAEHLYPVNYGHVPGTMAADGHEIDAYVLGPVEPINRFRGICMAIIHRLDDLEDKLVVAKAGQEWSDLDIRRSVDFQERYFRTLLLR